MNQIVEQAYVEVAGTDQRFHKSGNGPKRVLVMSGLPFSGKSYLANMIMEWYPGQIILVRSDIVRPRVARYMGRETPMYDADEHANVFAVCHELVKRGLEMNHPVIADATNLTNRFRAWGVDAAKETGGEALVAFLKISDSLAMDRALKDQRSNSAATPAVYALLRYEREPIENSTTQYVIIESDKDVFPQAKMLAKWLCGKTEKIEGLVAPQVKMEASTP